jgi:2-polyprenyl-3-methyl-5-hydroxy-6-metoxy-1,4-benzoquinol methylase
MNAIGQPDSNLMLEHPACPICDETEAAIVLRAGDDWVPSGPAAKITFAVMRCNRCRSCYTSPRFRKEFRHIAFQGEYPFYARARRNNSTLTDDETRPFLSRVAIVTKAHPDRGHVLDLGMGDGAFLGLMQRQGWLVSGMDTESSVVEFARTRLHLADCHLGDVEDDPFPAGPFDAITLWGAFQLLYRPGALLNRLRATLASGGILGIGVSNFASLGARIFRQHWKGLGMPRHLVHYEPDTICALLDRFGFEVVHLSFESPYWLIAESMRSRLPLPGLLARVSRRSVAALFAPAGRTSLAETMFVIARPKS